ncbi:MAG: single-stranded-DNA-specific exonuclease RecJ [Candidatus Lernaella stagnicola]|nr:single-stranded-DNA-specific exonuclease RecJ [Candidatus Lernaella stagnicola]
MPSARKRWIIAEANPLVERRLQDEVGVGPITARVLAARGLTDPAHVERFFHPRLQDLPHPHLMRDAEKAAGRIADALERGETIVVFGDYDADGVTASSVVADFMRNMGHPVRVYIPHRVEEGYGMQPGAVQELAAAGCSLLITVDCGSNDTPAITRAAELGVDTVVTDHHEIDGPLPPAFAMLNPHQADCGFHEEPLAGVGVAFFLVAAVRIELAKRGHEVADRFDMKRLLDLVALGTVADIVPLVGVNRALVTAGLKLIDEAARPGIAALKRVAGVGSPVRAGDIGYRLAPRINAAGRMGDASVGVDLLLTDDPAKARAIAQQLHEENTKRQAVEATIFAEARRMFTSINGHERLRSIVLAHPQWHPGVIGIVASRMVEAFHRPTVLIAARGEVGQGSGRSISAFNLHEAVSACASHLEGCGGHAQAAGLQIRPENIVAFAQAFEEHTRGVLQTEDLAPRQHVDAWCEIDEISESLVRELGQLAPFGCGNPEPVLAARDVEVLNKQIVGRDHLKMRIPCRRSALAVIAYGFAPMSQEIGSRIDLAFTPEFSYYGGVEHVQLRAKDLAIPDK